MNKLFCKKNTFCESLAMADLFCRGNEGQMKCDKIGLFLEGPGKKISCNSCPNIRKCFGLFWNTLLFKQNLPCPVLGQLWRNLGNLLF